MVELYGQIYEDIIEEKDVKKLNLEFTDWNIGYGKLTRTFIKKLKSEQRKYFKESGIKSYIVISNFYHSIIKSGEEVNAYLYADKERVDDYHNYNKSKSYVIFNRIKIQELEEELNSIKENFLKAEEFIKHYKEKYKCLKK